MQPSTSDNGAKKLQPIIGKAAGKINGHTAAVKLPKAITRQANAQKATEIANRVQENKLYGFIPLYRSIKDHWIWKDAEKLKWWIDLLISANYSSKKVMIGNRVIECK